MEKTLSIKKKRAKRSLFFWYSLYTVLALVFSIISIFYSSNALQLSLFLIYGFSLLSFSGEMSSARTFKKFLKLHLFFLPVCILVLFSTEEGKVYRILVCTVTSQGLEKSGLLYLKLSALFWLTKACTCLIHPDTMKKGLGIFLVPLRLVGLDSREGALILFNALFLLPDLLARVPEYLKEGHGGLRRLFLTLELEDAPDGSGKYREMCFYEILLAVSLPIMTVAVFLG